MRSQATTKVRQTFIDLEKPLTLTDIKVYLPELKASQISMSLCYLMRARWVTRESRDNPTNRGRKFIWLYNFYPNRLPK